MKKSSPLLTSLHTLDRQWKDLHDEQAQCRRQARALWQPIISHDHAVQRLRRRLRSLQRRLDRLGQSPGRRLTPSQVRRRRRQRQAVRTQIDQVDSQLHQAEAAASEMDDQWAAAEQCPAHWRSLRQQLDAVEARRLRVVRRLAYAA